MRLAQIPLRCLKQVLEILDSKVLGASLMHPGDRFLSVDDIACHNVMYCYGNIGPNPVGINMFLALFLSLLT